jgi:hypothetical protein
MRDPSSLPTLAAHLAEQQRIYTERILTLCRGDKAKAAMVLAVDPASLS